MSLKRVGYAPIGFAIRRRKPMIDPNTSSIPGHAIGSLQLFERVVFDKLMAIALGSVKPFRKIRLLDFFPTFP